jgi:hypothetical protein
MLLIPLFVFGTRLLLFLLRPLLRLQLQIERLVGQTVLPALPEFLWILQAIFCCFGATSARSRRALKPELIPIRRVCAYSFKNPRLRARLCTDLRQQLLRLHIFGGGSIGQGLFNMVLDIPVQLVRNRAPFRHQGLSLGNALFREAERQLHALSWRSRHRQTNLFCS